MTIGDMNSLINSIGLAGAVSSVPFERNQSHKRINPERALTVAERKQRHYARVPDEERRAYKRELKVQKDSTRPFIAWDGEGVNTKGANKPQAYVLFGCSTGDYVTREDGITLPFSACAELILDVGEKNPDAWHIGYAFDYDVNQIIRTLPFHILQILNETGRCRWGNYRIQWRKGKSFRITHHGETIRSVTIYDIFHFFATSFVKAIEKVFGKEADKLDGIQKVIEGKKRRNEFTLEDLYSEIYPYWDQEIKLLALLVSQFRDLLYNADLPITQWHGPGAIASLVLNRFSIKQHMCNSPDEVVEAAQYAYAGGRFEQFRVGRYQGPVWTVDRNSAYPAALLELPSLMGGTWTRRSIGKSVSQMDRREITQFAIWEVELSHPEWRIPHYPNTPPGPLFYRTDKGEMRYPWHVRGWYWGPEVENLFHPKIAPYAKIHSVWEFTPATDEKPFAFIGEMYTRRKQWKKEGRIEELALKLAMNSIYGKLAQRVGWEQSGKAPAFHQIEWAGFVTSFTRAQMFRAMWQFGNDIVSVETDGVCTLRDPSRIGIVASDALGEWSVSKYDEIIYLQSGTYFARAGDKWFSKYRGLDPESLSVEDAALYLSQVDCRNPKWEPIIGTTTRFLGLATAMVQASGDHGRFRGRHALWEQEKEKRVTPGTGKRQHYPDSCVECSKGISPSDFPHYMGVNIDLLPDGINHSTKHYLPWRDGKAKDETTTWRHTLVYEQGKLFDL